MQTTDIWTNAHLDTNRAAFAMAEREFVDANGRAPETLVELQSVWRRQSVILSQMK